MLPRLRTALGDADGAFAASGRNAAFSRWAPAIRANGRIPLYSTLWHNLASRAVARKLGLVLSGADLTIA